MPINDSVLILLRCKLISMFYSTCSLYKSSSIITIETYGRRKYFLFVQIQIISVSDLCSCIYQWIPPITWTWVFRTLRNSSKKRKGPKNWQKAYFQPLSVGYITLCNLYYIVYGN